MPAERAAGLRRGYAREITECLLTKKDRIIRSVSGITFPPGGFAGAIAAALRREYGATHASVKTVVSLTGANERAVKNWFDAKNAPERRIPRSALLAIPMRYSRRFS